MPAPSTQPASPPGRPPHRPGRQPGGRRRRAPGVMASARPAPMILASTAPGAGPRLGRGRGPLCSLGRHSRLVGGIDRLSFFGRRRPGAQPALQVVVRPIGRPVPGPVEDGAESTDDNRPRTLEAPADGDVQILETRRASSVPVAEPAGTHWWQIVFEHIQRPAAPVRRPSCHRPGQATALSTLPTAGTPHNLSLAIIRAMQVGVSWALLPSSSPAAVAKATTDAIDSWREQEHGPHCRGTISPPETRWRDSP